MRQAIGAVLLCCCLVASPATASTRLNWTARDAQITGVTASAVRALSLDAVSCASPGNCSAVGSYDASSGAAHVVGLLVSQVDGQWQSGVTATLPAGAATNPQVKINSVSCASAGNCTAVGHYVTTTGAQQGLLLTQTAGTWSAGSTAALPGNAASNPLAELSSVSCTSDANCVAVGSYADATTSHALHVKQTEGVWGIGVEANAAAPSSFASVSCASAGNCTAVGRVHASGSQRGMLVPETGGFWGSAVEAPVAEAVAGDADLRSVSCTGASACGAVGIDRTDQSQLPPACGGMHGPGCPVGLFGQLVSQTSGGVTTAETQPAAGVVAPATTDQWTSVPDVSCPSAGNCTVVGRYRDDNLGSIDSDGDGNVDTGPGEIFTQSGGTWAAGELIADTEGSAVRNLQSVSCVSVAACAATGDTRDSFGSFHGAWLLTRQAGSWLAAERAPLPTGTAPVGGSLLNDISCTSDRACAAVGSFADADGVHHGWLLSALPATPTLAITAPAALTTGTATSDAHVTLANGAAPTGTLSWRVFGPQADAPSDCTSGGTALGSVAVSGNSDYAVPQSFTPTAEGRYWWFASYDGDTGNFAASSPCGPAMASTSVTAPSSSSTATSPTDSGSATITGDQPGGATTTATGDKLAPAFLSASITPRRLKSKAKLRFKLSEPARVVVTIERKRGRKFVRAQRLTLAAVKGANVKTIRRGTGRRRLRAGAYRVTLVATDAAGNRSAPKRIKFRVG